MTLGDFVKRLEGMIEGKGIYQSATRNAQVKLAKRPRDTFDVYDFFEVKKIGDDIVLVPSEVWDRSQKGDKQ